MTVKRISIVARPARTPTVDAWIRRGAAQLPKPLTKTDIFTARLTLDITPALRARIKIAAFERGLTVADLLRDLLETSFPVTTEIP